MARNIPNLTRKKPSKQVKKTYYLVCEGGRTEFDYFTALEKSISNALLRMKIVRGAGVPMTIAGKAAQIMRENGLAPRMRKRLNSFEERDEVWAVFDRDEFPDYNNALSLCADSGVYVARSNPCFEVWMILHFNDYDRDEHRHQTQEAFEKLCPDYDKDKRKTTDCTKLVALVEDAERRADVQLKRRGNEGSDMDAPSTTVHFLTRKLRDT